MLTDCRAAAVATLLPQSPMLADRRTSAVAAPSLPPPMPSRISGATSSSGSERSMSTSTGRGKNKGKAPKVWQTQWEKPKKRGKGAWPSGPTRSKPKGKGGKGKSPNSPSVPWPDHWAFKNAPSRGSSSTHCALQTEEAFCQRCPPHRTSHTNRPAPPW